MLDELRSLLPPPEQPFFAEGGWAAIEKALGLALPSDYKAFIGTYGSGEFGGLVIHSPFIWVKMGRDVREAWISWASAYDDFAAYGGVEIPYPVFPKAHGLLPFGTLVDSNILNWLTIGEPDSWPFVYYDSNRGFHEIKGLSAVEFALEAVTRRSPLLVRMGLDSCFEPPCKFEPFTGLS